MVVVVGILGSAATIPCPGATSDAAHLARHLRLLEAGEQLTERLLNQVEFVFLTHSDLLLCTSLCKISLSLIWIDRVLPLQGVVSC